MSVRNICYCGCCGGSLLSSSGPPQPLSDELDRDDSVDGDDAVPLLEAALFERVVHADFRRRTADTMLPDIGAVSWATSMHETTEEPAGQRYNRLLIGHNANACHSIRKYLSIRIELVGRMCSNSTRTS